MHAVCLFVIESLCPSLGSGPTLAQGPSALAPLLFGTTFHYLSIQPPRLPPSEDVSKHTFSTWPSPVDPSVPNGLLMLQNSLNDFVNTNLAVAPLSLATPGILAL